MRKKMPLRFTKKKLKFKQMAPNLTYIIDLKKSQKVTYTRSKKINTSFLNVKIDLIKKKLFF